MNQLFKRFVLSILIAMCLTLPQCDRAQTKIDRNASEVDIEKAIEIVKTPTKPFASMYMELQARIRLEWLDSETQYKYVDRHQDAWLELLRDKASSVYARLCAASFLLGRHKEARELVVELTESENLRHRYNATEILGRYVSDNTDCKWGAQVLIDLVSSGALDGRNIDKQDEKKYPEGDKDDILLPPLDLVCEILGKIEDERIVPILIAVLERQPDTFGAAYALGEIGDPRGAPVLMQVVKEKPLNFHIAVRSLGKLKHREAVPVLIALMDDQRKNPNGPAISACESSLRRCWRLETNGRSNRSKKLPGETVQKIPGKPLDDF